MKISIKIVAITLILGTSSILASNSNNYQISSRYKLLNDMNFAKKQQQLILEIDEALKTNHLNMVAYKKFTKILLGLLNGDKSLNLRGTNIPKIKSKLAEIQKLWKYELSTLKNANSDKNIEKAIQILNNITIKIEEVVSLYDKSYNRFKQRRKFSFIVNQHTLNSNQKQIFALNIKPINQ